MLQYMLRVSVQFCFYNATSRDYNLGRHSLAFSQRPLVTIVLVIRMDGVTCYRCIKCTTRQRRVCSVMPFLCVKNKEPQKFASWWCTKHVMEKGVDMVQWS